MKNIIVFAALAFFVIAGCEKGEWGAPATDEQNLELRAQDRPFTAIGTALGKYPDWNYGCVWPAYESEYEGSIKGNIIGKAGIFWEGCFNPENEGGARNTGHAIIYTKKGELYMNYDVILTPSDVEGVGNYSGTYEFTGGTGQFANAHGTGTVTGTQDLNFENYPVTMEMVGTIGF